MIKNSRFERFRCVTFHFTVTVCVCVCANMWRKFIHNWFFECNVLIWIEWLLNGKRTSDSLFFNPFVVSRQIAYRFFIEHSDFFLIFKYQWCMCQVLYFLLYFSNWNLKLLIKFNLYMFFISWIINCLTF